jgi:hypothetical protein
VLVIAASVAVGNPNKLRRRGVLGADPQSFSPWAGRLSIPNQLRRRPFVAEPGTIGEGSTTRWSVILTDDSDPSSLAVRSQPCPNFAMVSLIASQSSTSPVMLSLLFMVIFVATVVAAVAVVVIGAFLVGSD